MDQYINNQEFLELAKNYGFTPDRHTLRRWRQGWYIHAKTHQKVWYFPDKRNLTHVSASLGKGYLYNRAIAISWLYSMGTRQKTAY